MEQPITYRTPSIVICPIEFVIGPLFPKRKNNLPVGALKFKEIRRLTIDHDRVTEQKIF